MVLSELCEPIFSYVCNLRRLSRNGVDFTYLDTRKEVKMRLDSARDIASKDTSLSYQFSRIELPIIFFIDYMIKESNLSFASEWQEFAYEKNELSGDEKFFDMLDETLNDPSGSATECLRIFYTCIALGFRGCFVGTPDVVLRKLQICGLRLGLDADHSSADSLLCNDIPASADSSKHFKDPRGLLVKVIYCGLALLLVALLLNFIMYSVVTSELRSTLDKIIDGSPVEITQKKYDSRYKQ